MATFRERVGKNGSRWQAIIRKQTPDRLGLVELRETFATKTAAVAWARKTESAIESGTYLTETAVSPAVDIPVIPTLREVVAQYITKVASKHKGLAVEVDILRRLVDGRKGEKPILDADKPITSYTSRDISEYRDSRLAQVSFFGTPVGTGTVRRELSLLGRVFIVARDEWCMGNENPVAKVKLPSEPKGRTRRLEAGELDRLLSCIKNERVKDVILLAIETAMRRSEITYIKPADVDINKGHIFLKDTKNGESRTVPLTPSAKVIVGRCLQRVELMGYTTLFGLNHVSITHSFEAGCKKAGIVDLKLHDLRHEATSRFIEMGLSTQEVMAITGHKSLTMLSRYTQLRTQDIVAKLAKLSKDTTYEPT
ncbi:MAG: site-specific integrase [Acidithiobacillus ferriphilus]